MSQTKKSLKKTLPEVRPLADRAVLRPIDDGEQMKGGLHIPDTAKEKPQQGVVAAVGPGGMEKGHRVPMELEIGQKVLYGRYTGTEVTLDDQKLLIVKESDVLAIIG